MAHVQQRQRVVHPVHGHVEVKVGVGQQQVRLDARLAHGKGVAHSALLEQFGRAPQKGE
jgi:hypothetical protein